jgi:hypothetical protein
MVYSWFTRLRYGVLSYAAALSRSHLCIPSDAPENPAMHAAFLFLFFVCMFAYICTAFCDPGICATQSKDALKSVREFFPLPHQKDCTKVVGHPFDILYRLWETLFKEIA